MTAVCTHRRARIAAAKERTAEAAATTAAPAATEREVISTHETNVLALLGLVDRVQQRHGGVVGGALDSLGRRRAIRWSGRGVGGGCLRRRSESVRRRGRPPVHARVHGPLRGLRDQGDRRRARSPYTPSTPLWSDGAQKQRWIELPPNTQIDISNPNEWTFPVGTKLFKEFRVNGKRVETRMFQKQTSKLLGLRHVRLERRRLRRRRSTSAAPSPSATTAAPGTSRRTTTATSATRGGRTGSSASSRSASGSRRRRG